MVHGQAVERLVSQQLVPCEKARLEDAELHADTWITDVLTQWCDILNVLYLATSYIHHGCRAWMGLVLVGSPTSGATSPGPHLHRHHQDLPRATSDVHLAALDAAAAVARAVEAEVAEAQAAAAAEARSMPGLGSCDLGI